MSATRPHRLVEWKEDTCYAATMNVESITVFRPTGPLNRVWLMWEVVKKFYRLSDDAHLKEIASLEREIDAFGEGDPSQQTLRAQRYAPIRDILRIYREAF